VHLRVKRASSTIFQLRSSERRRWSGSGEFLHVSGEEVLVARVLHDWLWVSSAAVASAWIPATCVVFV
jgi:hypothetical protein